MIRVFLIHQHAIARERLCNALEIALDIVVVGEAAKADQTLAAVRAQHLDVIIAGLIPQDIETDGPTADEFTELPLVVFAPLPGCGGSGGLRCGPAVAHVCLGAVGHVLIDAVRAVHAGERYICSCRGDADKRMHSGGSKTAQRLSRLTRRELELLHHLATGKPNREIARALRLSVKTVSTHRMHILAKLGLHSTAELIRLALEQDLLDT